MDRELSLRQEVEAGGGGRCLESAVEEVFVDERDEGVAVDGEEDHEAAGAPGDVLDRNGTARDVAGRSECPADAHPIRYLKANIRLQALDSLPTLLPS